MGIAGAVIGSAVIGAGASMAAGSKAAGAQKDAAAQNAALQREQMAENARQYDQNRADLAPYRDAGYTALGQLARGTADGGEFNRNFTLADFNADPGYQFRKNEGAKALDASAAARGGVLSGAAMKAMARYGQDFASNEYGKAYDRYNNDQTTRYNRLAGLAGTGQTATNSTIAAGNTLQNQQQEGVNNIASQNNAAANATASQYAGVGNAVSGLANNVGNYYAMKSLYSPAGGGYSFNPVMTAAPSSYSSASAGMLG